VVTAAPRKAKTQTPRPAASSDRPVISAEVIAPLDRAMREPEYFVHEYCKSIKGDKDRGTTEVLLIPRFPYFASFWKPLADRLNIHGLKSKQLTVSWLCSAVALWDVITPYHRNWSDLIMSRAQELVDDGGDNSTPDSLFGKIRFLYDHLPRELQFPMDFSFCRITNKRTGSVIKGKSTTSHSGRGGHHQRAFIDEADFIDHSESVADALGDGCEQIIMVSTANRLKRGGWFQRIERLDSRQWVHLRWHWSQHPERTCTCTDPLDLDPSKHHGCWYARECEKRTPYNIACELNFTREGAITGRVFSAFNPAIHLEDGLEIIPGLPIYRAWDFGVNGSTAITLAQVQWLNTVAGNLVPQIRIFDYYENSEQPAVHYRQVLQDKAEWDQYSQLGCRVMDYGDPHNLTSRNADPKLSSWHDYLANSDHPYVINVQPTGCVGYPYETVVDNARKFFSVVECNVGGQLVHVPRVLIKSTLHRFVEILQNWTYPVDDDGNVRPDSKPHHDDLSHGGDAFKYLAWTVSPIYQDGRGVPGKNDLVVVRGETFRDNTGTFRPRKGSVFPRGKW
jgi:hypothetical protein